MAHPKTLLNTQTYMCLGLGSHSPANNYCWWDKTAQMYEHIHTLFKKAVSQLNGLKNLP